MKLTVDCVINAGFSGLQNKSALDQFLKKAKIAQFEIPLEAYICNQYGLQSAPDYPIAAISAAADDLDVGAAYWLRADPVHLVLQKDCFSLGEKVPLEVDLTHAELLIASLNQHFNVSGLAFFIGKSGAWYLRLDNVPQIKTTLPSVVIDKNIHQFLPQGAEAVKWVALLNEMQMLLHLHPANEARESIGELPVNSIWLSGGGVMPKSHSRSDDVSLIFANSSFYRGLAKWADIPCQSVPDDLESFLHSSLNNRHLRLQILQTNNLVETWLNPILSALKNNKIKQLTLNISFYEKSITAEIRPIDIYKFWRNNKPVVHYLK